ncbi:MAG: hypothetical protein ABSB40_12835 [Nitrososphaeria archaeon]|jgi:hypothetical protein
MRAINRLDVLIISLVVIFVINLVAVRYSEPEGILITAMGTIVTLTGYAFIRPMVVNECNMNGDK